MSYRKLFTVLSLSVVTACAGRQKIDYPEFPTPKKHPVVAVQSYETGSAGFEVIETEEYLKCDDDDFNTFAIDEAYLSASKDYDIAPPEAEEDVAEWYTKAADAGVPSAQFALGYKYEYGIDKPQNINEAVKWYKVSADKGYPQSLYKLGELYSLGKGVEKNMFYAAFWYGKAGQKGLSKAWAKQKEIKNSLSASELEKLENMLSD